MPRHVEQAKAAAAAAAGLGSFDPANWGRRSLGKVRDCDDDDEGRKKSTMAKEPVTPTHKMPSFLLKSTEEEAHQEKRCTTLLLPFTSLYFVTKPLCCTVQQLHTADPKRDPTSCNPMADQEAISIATPSSKPK